MARIRGITSTSTPRFGPRFLLFACLAGVFLVASASRALATATYQPLPFSQNWSNGALITASDNWNGVPGIVGYRGDGLTVTTGIDPQTVLSDDLPGVIDVNANQTDPVGFTAGGVAEFQGDAVALTGSSTADAPYLVFYVNASGWSSINVAYLLADLEGAGSTDDAVQQVALQYRISGTGGWTNVPAGYRADVTTGPGTAIATIVNVTLPANANNVTTLQIRVITTNALGNDEWVGVDDIVITGTAVPFVDATVFPLNDPGTGNGAAWGDYDRDGDLDLYLTNNLSGRNKLYRNDGGTWFADSTSPLGGAGSYWSAAWGDYDNDGDLDLFVNGSPNKLLRNDGGSWANVTSGPLVQARGGRNCLWGDFDNDGDLDLFTANDADTCKLFVNNAGSWVDATIGPLAMVGNNQGAAAGDYDNDGDLDLYVVRASGSGNRLLRNDGGSWANVTSGPLAGSGNGRGVAWGDYDNDGDLDLYVSNFGAANQLFRNDGGTWVNATPAPLNDAGTGTGVAWGDYDNDGDLDLFLSNQSGTTSKLFRNEGGTWTVMAAGVLGTLGARRGVAWGDYDNDGDLDLYLASTGPSNRLLRNEVYSGNHWFHLNLVGTASNRSAIGARVRVVAGGLFSQIQEVSGGSGYVSQNSLTAEFGLGAATTIDSIIVRWPSGVVWDTTGVAVDQRRTIIERFESPLITGVGPDHGGNGGPVTLVISGWGIVSGATARLTRSGESDIVGSAANVTANGRSLTATFSLAGKALGAWNVVVTNPDLGTGTRENAFTIELDAARQLRVDLIGSFVMRPERRRAFDVVIENLGNVDMTSVPLWISNIPATATLEPDFAVAPPPQAGGEPDWSTVPLTFDAAGGHYLALVIPQVPPGVTVRRFYLTVPNTVTQFTLDASVTPPWMGEAFKTCLTGGGASTAPVCLGTQLDAIGSYLAVTPGIEALSGIGLWAKIAWQCEGSASLPAALAISKQALDFMLQPIAHAGVPSDCEGSLVPRWQDTLAVRVVTSVDPNDKLGADGQGPARQIGSQQLLPYSIRFENKDSTGVVPAQSIVVTDVLDANKFDLTTVSLGPIKFGRRANGHPWTVDPGSGLQSYTADVDLWPDQDLLVRVWVNLDQATGVLGWSLTALDRATGQLPDDPLVGFLPRNTTPPEGEGTLFFTVSPKPGLLGGTVIRNRATINFDGVAVQTPEWTNSLDDAPPQSEVQAFNPVIQDSARFTVHWQSTGAPPDLRDFSVYVSEGGAYRPWRIHTTATADTFAGPGGVTYSFYSLARDSSGNLEPVPGAPDAQTFSRVAVDEPARLALALEGAFPNPTSGPVRVWFSLPSRERAVLEMLDVTGRRVLRRDVGAMGPGRHSVDVSAAARRPGMYFLRLVQGGRALHARMAVIR